MSGKKGMCHKYVRPTSFRNKIWRSMRIMHFFTMPDLLRAVPGLNYVNLRKFVRSLLNHGVVTIQTENFSGRIGSYTQYRLVVNDGPNCPTLCKVCGQQFIRPCEGKEFHEVMCNTNE